MVTGKWFWGMGVLLVAGVMLLMSSCANVPENDKDLPNILILYADDMGYGDLACQNPGSKIPTPNLDQLAADGIRFTDAHSSSGICTPSRYALLTGRYHWRKFHRIVQSFGETVFDPDRLTLPDMLKTKGYVTACIGKWHLGWSWDSIRIPGSSPAKMEIGGRTRDVFQPGDFDWEKPVPGGPVDHGFDYYFGDDVINFPPYTWIENDQVLEAPDGLYTKGVENTPEGNWECRAGPTVEGWDYYRVLPTLTEKAVDYIHQQAEEERPFFLYMAFPSPHAPIIPNDDFRGLSEAGAYGDFVYQTDWCAGEIMDAVKETGKWDNTLVIFTSDNGPETYAYPRVVNHDHYSMGPLRGVKRDIWDGGHRVPFILRWPDNHSAGNTIEVPVSQVDIMATLAELAGYTMAEGDAEDSFSLIPLLFEKEGSEYLRQHVVHNTFEDRYAIRNREWILIDHKTGNQNRPERMVQFDSIRGYEPHGFPGELYRMADDPGQMDNLYGDHPEKVEELLSVLQRIKGEGRSR